MNGIRCDNCGAGYRPGQLMNCSSCKKEFCGSCERDHGC